MKRSLFMCPPDYFGIEYEINPWMNVARQADRGLARKQWKKLYDFLTTELKLDVQLMDPVEGLPDMCFTANAGLAKDKKFISSNFRNEERRRECLFFEGWFEKKGYLVYNLSPELYFEGEGDLLFADDAGAYAGYLIRSDVKSHAAVADILGIHIASLELVDPRFYHLDTCFCPLNPETVVYYPGAFDAYAREVIGANFADRVEVSEKEAENFVCNALVVENHYVQPAGGRRNLRPALESRGYQVHEFDMSEFIKAGGAVKCLVLDLGETSGEDRTPKNWGGIDLIEGAS